jgi:hypothetical protein
VYAYKEKSDSNKAKAKTSVLAWAIEHSHFDMVVGLLIVANCIVMTVQLEYSGHLGQISMGRIEDDGSWDNADRWFAMLEHVFNSLFLIELLGRLAVHRLRLFFEVSACFDVLIVVVSTIQLYVVAGHGTSLLRMLRFLRFVRVLRIVRVLKLFHELRVLVKTCISSFRALIWSMILLSIMMIIGALFLCEVLKDFIRDESNDMQWRLWVFRYYGTSSRAIYTLFEVTLAGCWPTYFRPLIEQVSGRFVVFVVLYIAGVVFAVIRIITAIFLRETLRVASDDAEMMLTEETRKKNAYLKKLEHVFKAVDTSGNGTLNLEELEAILQNHEIRSWLKVLELEFHDAQGLFQLLDPGDGEITYDDFLKGVTRLKGTARSIDVVSILWSNDKMAKSLNNLERRFIDGGLSNSPVHSSPVSASRYLAL